jgi:hypothetical protein
MKQTTLVILILLIYSCNSNIKENRNNVLSSRDTLQHNSGQNLNLQNKYKNGLDILDFKKHADSLITIILDKPTSFVIVTDTIDDSKLKSKQKSYLSSLENLLATKSDLFIKYNFKLGKPDNLLSFDLFEAFYNSSDSLDLSFSILKKSSNGIIVEEDSILNVPGLTYENDYLLRSDSYLIWFHTGCAYGFNNHLKFARALKESLINIVFQDSIVCRCGQVICK